MNRTRGEPLNLLELKPSRSLEWEDNADGEVVLLVPKFSAPLLRRWLLPLLPTPAFRVKLDSFGTFVWRRCDGVTPVSEIAAQLSRRFGPGVEPLYERIEVFLRKLQQNGFITID